MREREDDLLDFHHTPLTMMEWRLFIFPATFVFLWLVRHPYLDPVTVPSLIVPSIKDPSGETIPYLVLRWPAMLKFIVFAPLISEALTRIVWWQLPSFARPPFLTFRSGTLCGRTSLGQQSVAWSDVSGVTRRTRLTLLGEVEQLVISTWVVAEPKGLLPRLRGDAPGHVTFVTPASEESQIPAIIAALRICAPDVAVTEDEIDSRPAWLQR